MRQHSSLGELGVSNESHEFQIIIRKQVHTELKLALQSMFNHRDSYALELVDESHNIGDQAKIFEAMRLVRLQKEAMTAEFLAFFDKSYTKQIVSNHAAGLTIDDYLYNDMEHSHSLIDDEVLEIRAAVDKMTDKIKRSQWALQDSLTKQFSLLVGHQYDVNNYPVSAWVICESFAKVVGRLKTRFSKKLIIIKMFEHSVIPELKKLYQKIDSIMDEYNIGTIVEYSDISTELSEGSIKPANTGLVVSSVGGAKSESTSELDYNVKRFVAMQEMLHNDVGTQTNASSTNQYSAVSANYYSSDDVITGLSVLQEKILMLDHIECIALNSHVKPNLFRLLNIMGDQNQGLKLDRKSSDVIDIVSMMFDFILDDQALPVQLRTIIIRLQIPIIKVALLDDEFFNSRLQSARQLLNELAYSAHVQNLVGDIDSQKGNVVIAQVERIVDIILKTFTVEVKIFTRELRNFQQFVRLVLKGRKEETKHLQFVKNIVVAEIKQRLTTQNVPDVVDIFIRRVWNEVLTKVGMTTQCQGKIWQAILQVTDDLIWSTQPKLMEQERKLLTNMIPRLLNRLQDGLCLINYSRALIEQFFQHMEQVHLNSLRGAKGQSALKGNISLLAKSAGFHYKNNEQGAGMASVLSELNNYARKVKPAAEPHSSAFFLGMPDADLMLNPSFITVTEMSIGTWVAFSINNQTSIGKLEWKCDFTEEYRFVDRNYTVVHSDNRLNLVKLFDQSKAKVIDDIPLFDRAVDAVYHGLQVA